MLRPFVQFVICALLFFVVASSAQIISTSTTATCATIYGAKSVQSVPVTTKTKTAISTLLTTVTSTPTRTKTVVQPVTLISYSTSVLFKVISAKSITTRTASSTVTDTITLTNTTTVSVTAAPSAAKAKRQNPIYVVTTTLIVSQTISTTFVPVSTVLVVVTSTYTETDVATLTSTPIYTDTVLDTVYPLISDDELATQISTAIVTLPSTTTSTSILSLTGLSTQTILQPATYTTSMSSIVTQATNVEFDTYVVTAFVSTIKSTTTSHILTTTTLASHYANNRAKRDGRLAKRATSYAKSVVCSETDVVFSSRTIVQIAIPTTISTTTTPNKYQTLIIKTTSTIYTALASTSMPLMLQTQTATATIITTATVTIPAQILTTTTVTSTVLLTSLVQITITSPYVMTSTSTQTITVTEIENATLLQPITVSEIDTITSPITTTSTSTLILIISETSLTPFVATEIDTQTALLVSTATSTSYVSTFATVLLSTITSTSTSTSIISLTTTSVSTAVSTIDIVNVRKKYLPDWFLSGQTTLGFMNLSIVTTAGYCAPGNAGRYIIDIYGTMAGNSVSYDVDQEWLDPGSCLTMARFPYVTTQGFDFEVGSAIYNIVLTTTGYPLPNGRIDNHFDGNLRAQLSSWNSTSQGDVFANSDMFVPMLTAAPGASLPPAYSPGIGTVYGPIVYLEFYTAKFGNIQLKIYTSSTSNSDCPYAILDILGVHGTQQVTFDRNANFQGRDNCIFNDPDLFISVSGINYNAGGQTYNAYKAYENGGWNMFITDYTYDNEWAYYQNMTLYPTDAFVDCNPSFACIKSVYTKLCPQGQTFNPRVASQCSSGQAPPSWIPEH